jgi:TPR repeat protein
VKLFEVSAAGGDSYGLYSFAVQLWYGNGIEIDHARACPMMLQAALLGEVDAFRRLAEWILGGECSIHLAPLDLYEHAAEQNDIASLLRLGAAYAKSELGVTRDLAKAKSFYERVVNSSRASDMEKQQASEAIAKLTDSP